MLAHIVVRTSSVCRMLAHSVGCHTAYKYVEAVKWTNVLLGLKGIVSKNLSVMCWPFCPGVLIHDCVFLFFKYIFASEVDLDLDSFLY